MPRRSFSGLSSAGFIVAMLSPSAGTAQPSRHSGERVRVTYEAFPGCPAAGAFLAQVRARIGTDWEAPAGMLARTIEVRVSAVEPLKVARIDFLDDHGQQFTRTVSATTCEEVVAGIALITALAIESRVAEALGERKPGPADAPAALQGTKTPTGPQPAAPRAAGPSPMPAPARPRPRASPARPIHFDVGGAGLLGSGVGPALATGVRGFLGFGWANGPDVRLGVDYLSTPLVDSSGGFTDFSLLGARASGCPVAVGFGTSFRLLPCAGAVVGAHRGEGLGKKTVVSPGADAPAFFTPFASLRAEVGWDAFFAEVEGEARFPVDHHRFFFKTDPETDAHRVPWLAFGFSIGVGLRL